MDHYHEHKNDASVAASTYEEFFVMMKNTYGNLLRAWSVLMDPNRLGLVNYTRFCKCARESGYEGALKSLWQRLDLPPQPLRF